MMRQLFLLLCALAISGCGSSDDEATPTGVGIPRVEPLPECPEADYSTCDITEAACQTRLFELAACMRESEVPSDIRIELKTEAQYAEIVTLDLLDDPPPLIDHFARALAMLDLAPATPPSQEQDIAAFVANLYGVFRQNEQRIIIIDHGDDTSSSLARDAVLLHEMVHAIQHAENDLSTWPRVDEPWTFDRRLAAKSLVEGEASFYEYRAAAPLLGVDIASVDFDMVLAEHLSLLFERVESSESPYDASYLSVPYAIGAPMVHARWLDGGPKGVEALWAEPPRTTQQILAELYAMDEPQAQGLEIEAPVIQPPGPLGGLTLDSWDTLGAWGLYLYYVNQDVDDPLPHALSWRGDQLGVYTDGQNTYALWQVELGNEAEAQLLDRTFRVLSEAGHGAHGTSGTRAFLSIGKLRDDMELTDWGGAWLTEE